MKSRLRSLIPSSLKRAYRRVKQAQESRRNANRTPEEVFTEIYREGTWGSGAGSFCSGSGSTDDSITQPYVTTVRALLRSFADSKPNVVDLGCGDFRVGRQLVDDCKSYTGVDVVHDLVRHLQTSVADPSVRFLHLDIVRDELPPGDICLVRQVLQHLSNDQISRVLAKLSQYPVVVITEHHPTDSPEVTPNLDKVHGGGIRLFNRSGVYLDQPPFTLSHHAIELILEVAGHEFSGVYDPGVIRTFCLKHPTNRAR